MEDAALGRLQQLVLDLRGHKAVLTAGLDPVLDVRHGDHAAEAMAVRRSGERLTGECQGLARLAAPTGLQLRHPLDMGVQVQRIAAKGGVQPGLVDGGTQRHATAGGEQAAPRRDPFRLQLCRLEQQFLGDPEPLVEHPPLRLRDVHGKSAGAGLPAPVDVARAGYQQRRRPVFLVLLDGPADPVLHTVQVGQLTEDLIVAAEIEGGQRRLDRRPVTQPAASTSASTRESPSARSVYIPFLVLRGAGRAYGSAADLSPPLRTACRTCPAPNVPLDRPVQHKRTTDTTSTGFPPLLHGFGPALAHIPVSAVCDADPRPFSARGAGRTPLIHPPGQTHGRDFATTAIGSGHGEVAVSVAVSAVVAVTPCAAAARRYRPGRHPPARRPALSRPPLHRRRPTCAVDRRARRRTRGAAACMTLVRSSWGPARRRDAVARSRATASRCHGESAASR